MLWGNFAQSMTMPENQDPSIAANIFPRVTCPFFYKGSNLGEVNNIASIIPIFRGNR